ncbi:MAG: serpin family protein [Bacillota bacterium]
MTKIRKLILRGQKPDSGSAGQKSATPSETITRRQTGARLAVPVSSGPKPGAPGARNSRFALDPRIATANTRFAFKLFSGIVEQDSGKNVFISPQSVAVALATACNGAHGETREAMAKTLELQGISMEDINRGNAALEAALESLDPKIRLNIANSLWARKGLPFEQDFIEANEKFYGAKVENLDFTDPGAPRYINAWVKNKTEGKIEKIVDKINPDTILFLINAIYFKGSWSKGFDPEKTAEGVFNLPGGRQKKHPMMSRSGKYSYLQEPGFQAVSLPYGSGAVSMYVFLPDQGSSLTEFHRSLNARNWEGWMSRFSETNGNVVLPRFKSEYELCLNDALKSLGMDIAFDRKRADFRNIINVNGNAYIDSVMHKTFVEVNEEGTESAAVTSVVFGITCVRDEFNMVVDRPFFFAIRDNQTGRVGYALAGITPLRTVLALFTHTALHNSIHFK